MHFMDLFSLVIAMMPKDSNPDLFLVFEYLIYLCTLPIQRHWSPLINTLFTFFSCGFNV